MSVKAIINYVTTEDKFVPSEPLFSYTYPPPEDRPQTNERYDPHPVNILDIRNHPELTFEEVGFQVINSPTTISETDFESFSSNTDVFDPPDEAALKAYHDDIEGYIRQVIPGVIKVMTYNQKTRLHTPKTTVEGYDFSSVVNYPVLRPHIDLVPESAAELIEPYTNGASRVLIVNAWRPIRGTVLDAPLAVADPMTVSPKSKIYNRVLYRDREKGMYMIRDTQDKIQWYYLSAQTPDEILLFKQYDSERPDFIPPHSAFIDERYEGKEGVLPRHSIETRSVVLIG